MLPKKAIGINTAVSTSVIPTSAPLISCMDFKAAALASRCSSCIRRSIFSTTTMASSTSRPMAKIRANKVKLFRVISKTYSTAKVAKTTIGIVTAGIIVARQFCRKINITTMTRIMASTRVLATCSIELVINGVLSMVICN